jgi:hypothetical protein
VGLVRAVVGFAMLAKLLTGSLLRDLITQAPDAFLLRHPLLYAIIQRNCQKVRQLGILFPYPYLAFFGNHIVKE